MKIRTLLRRKLLEEIYKDLSDEDMWLFVQLTMQDKGYRDIMQALTEQHHELETIRRRQNWVYGFGSDVAANFTSAGILWVASRLFRKL